MKTLLAIFLFVGSSLCTIDNVHNGTYVYICTGPKAYSYHSNRYCAGLNNCTAQIKEVTVSYAKSIKRKPCKRCYK